LALSDLAEVVVRELVLRILRERREVGGDGIVELPGGVGLQAAVQRVGRGLVSAATRSGSAAGHREGRQSEIARVYRVGERTLSGWLKLAREDLYALGTHRGGIDERWFASTTAAANENAPPDEGLSYVVHNGDRFTLRDAIGHHGEKSIRVTNFVMPNACAVGGFEGYLGDGGVTMLCDVPLDNDHHWRWEFIFHRSGKLDKSGLDAQYRSEKGEGDRMWRIKDNNYSQDREAMKGKTYFGLGPCFSVHDIVITQSQGRIHDQSDEHLSSSDIAIMRARRALDEAAQAVASGQDPRGVIRTATENDFRDLVVITGVLAAEETKEAYVAALETKDGLYTPDTASQS